MTTTLLDQFLAQECSPYIRQLLEEAIADTSRVRPRLEFNRFEVTIERDASEVIIEDVLDASEAGVQNVSLDDFADALNRCLE